MVTLLDTTQIDSAFLLGVLNSKLLRAIWVGRFYDQRQTFPKIKGTYLKDLPIALPDFKKPADKSRHDKLVLLVNGHGQSAVARLILLAHVFTCTLAPTTRCGCPLGRLSMQTVHNRSPQPSRPLRHSGEAVPASDPN